MKRIWIAALMGLLLAGCVPLTSGLRSIGAPAGLPTPAPEDIAPAMGDLVAAREVEATLYFPTADLQNLTPLPAALSVSAGETLPQRLVAALQEEPGVDGAARALPEGIAVRSVRQSGATAVVDLSAGDGALDDPRRLFLMRAAIVRTLSGVNGIEWTDVLVDGRARTPFDLPWGAERADDAPVPALWAQAKTEAERIAEGRQSLERAAVLYYPARDGLRVVPWARALSFESDDPVGPLLKALADGEELDPALRPALPASSLVTGWGTVALEDGRRVVRLRFDGNLAAILDRAGLNAWQMYASISCTLAGFVPGLEGIQVYIGEGLLTRVESPSGEIALEQGVMTRALFEDTVGVLQTVYLTARDGSLRALSRPMNPEDALSPRRLLAPLFEDPAPWEENVSRVIPEGLSLDDLLGVRLERGEATLNFSAAFYAGCQRLTAQQERNLVYALVNTLTGLDGVDAVRFQFEGETIGAFVHEICLSGPLLRNPGLISPASP